MTRAPQSDQSRPRLPFMAMVIGFIAFVVTAIVVSSATPDGNLVVTLVPALAVGLAAFGLALWRIRRGEAD